MNKRYIVGYVEYHHESLGSDTDSSGWQSFYSTQVFSNKKDALNLFKKLQKDRWHKNVFLAEEIEFE